MSMDCKNTMCVLTASIYYVVAKVNGFVLLDVDMLPLQGEHWQTDQMLSHTSVYWPHIFPLLKV